MLKINSTGSALRKSIQKQNQIPSILKATANVVLSDLGGLSIKSGETVNLYTRFPSARVRTSVDVKYALDTGLLVPAQESGKKNTDL